MTNLIKESKKLILINQSVVDNVASYLIELTFNRPRTKIFNELLQQIMLMEGTTLNNDKTLKILCYDT